MEESAQIVTTGKWGREQSKSETLQLGSGYSLPCSGNKRAPNTPVIVLVTRWALDHACAALLVAFLGLSSPSAWSATDADVEWLRQFGTDADDEAAVITTTADGIYVAGRTGGLLPGCSAVGERTTFLRKYNSRGNEIWTRQVGGASSEVPLGIVADSNSIYLTGYTRNNLPGQISVGGKDVFVRRYDLEGNEIWARQFGSRVDEETHGVSVDATGVYVAGSTKGALAGQTNKGSFDAFVRKYDPDGNELWTRQFGTEALDAAYGVAADSTGLYVAGRTKGALTDQPNSGQMDAFIRKYDAAGNELWTRQFGTSGTDLANGVSACPRGVYVTGSTDDTFPGQVSSGDMDAFVRKYDADGNELWTRQFGTEGADSATGSSAGSGGVYVAGRTDGILPNEQNSGGYDAFVVKFAEHQSSNRRVVALNASH